MPPSSGNQTKSSRRGDEKLFLVIVLALAAIAGLGSWFAAGALKRHDDLREIQPDKPRRLENFSLTDSTGRTVTRTDMDGKILVVSFLFTSCSLTCPEVSRRMAEIQNLTATNDDVCLLSLTVDPRSDTPPVLAKWGARFGADTNRWRLLTGDKAQLLWLIGTSFLATETNNPFNSMPGNFTGTERIAVVDKHGRTRIYFDGLRPETPAAVVKEISQLRGEP
jgi:protein SCO1/2